MAFNAQFRPNAALIKDANRLEGEASMKTFDRTQQRTTHYNPNVLTEMPVQQ